MARPPCFTPSVHFQSTPQNLQHFRPWASVARGRTLGELHGGARARARVHVRAAAWMKAAFDCQTTHDRRPVHRCRPANAVIPPSVGCRFPPLACWLDAYTNAYQQCPSYINMAADPSVRPPWRDWWSAVERCRAQPWQLGDLLQFGNTRRARAVTTGGMQRRCGFAERRSIAHHATFEPRTLRSCAIASANFHRPRHTVMHAHRLCADLG